ncbi:hypothetical protein NMY22_g2008 [Coprinellus aureogranulatus]|nr:hypothetical protein NMY22_g2008 [Coprinellus aureogranulatus]
MASDSHVYFQSRLLRINGIRYGIKSVFSFLFCFLPDWRACTIVISSINFTPSPLPSAPLGSRLYRIERGVYCRVSLLSNICCCRSAIERRTLASAVATGTALVRPFVSATSSSMFGRLLAFLASLRPRLREGLDSPPHSDGSLSEGSGPFPPLRNSFRILLRGGVDCVPEFGVAHIGSPDLDIDRLRRCPPELFTRILSYLPLYILRIIQRSQDRAYAHTALSLSVEEHIRPFHLD